MESKDSVGNLLQDGDTVVINKDLKIKGMSKTLKRGTKVKNIRCTSTAEVFPRRNAPSVVVLKTQFLKKA